MGKVSDRYYHFENAWSVGNRAIKAIAHKDGKEIISESKHTVGAPVALKLTPILGPVGLQANGSDVALIDGKRDVTQSVALVPAVGQVDSLSSPTGVWRVVTTAARRIPLTINSSTSNAASTAWRCVPRKLPATST